MKLDTISEQRIPNSSGPRLSADHLRKDAMTSTSDLTDAAVGAKDDGENGGSGGGAKKVHKGQINALAKMLSALRR